MRHSGNPFRSGRNRAEMPALWQGGTAENETRKNKYMCRLKDAGLFAGKGQGEQMQEE